MTATIVRNVPVQTWGLPPTEEEIAEGVAAVTVFSPQGKSAIFMLLECADGLNIVGSHAERVFYQGSHDVGHSVASARRHALQRLRGLRDRHREHLVQRAREMAAGEAA
jgi:hypothetical protein